MNPFWSRLAQVVIWESGWSPLSLSDLVDAESVKAQYRRACTVVHPDKVGGSQEMHEAAQKIFTALREGYNSFKTELQKLETLKAQQSAAKMSEQKQQQINQTQQEQEQQSALAQDSAGVD